ncbi:TPA: hypothetical protein ACM38E_005014 [Escherichia coli]|uniref:hypothetical protein n=1 Tax=Enterobacteriaceae TaxID=543 RepID=UPI00132827EF|nr:hypothetical protein [Klebsiella pneumoniae]EAW4205267.1 hypothetical protein [Salmonella enterica]EFC9676695.1 hypothetical protein [Escherichia coli]MED9207403.1 hypothetical protein [Escherichia marmotae]EIH3106923.1 hypothetical protein [Escherichia coli]MCV4998176.1 hypothetical protein [Escherichia coli]
MRIDLDLNTIDELGDISDTVKLSRSLIEVIMENRTFSDLPNNTQVILNALANFIADVDEKLQMFQKVIEVNQYQINNGLTADSIRINNESALSNVCT